VEPVVERRYPLRQRKQVEFPDFVTYSTVGENDSKNVSVKDALSGPDKGKWEGAISEEISNHVENSTWDLVKRTPNMRVIGSKWVLCQKLDADGNPKFKARLVAQGFAQVKNVDYFETYSPVVKGKTVIR